VIGLSFVAVPPPTASIVVFGTVVARLAIVVASPAGADTVDVGGVEEVELVARMTTRPPMARATTPKHRAAMRGEIRRAR
jgi:hypothetical protein